MERSFLRYAFKGVNAWTAVDLSETMVDWGIIIGMVIELNKYVKINACPRSRSFFYLCPFYRKIGIVFLCIYMGKSLDNRVLGNYWRLMDKIICVLLLNFMLNNVYRGYISTRETVTFVFCFIAQYFQDNSRRRWDGPPLSSLLESRHDKTNKVSVRPAKTRISLGIRPVWSESSLCAQG